MLQTPSTAINNKKIRMEEEKYYSCALNGSTVTIVTVQQPVIVLQMERRNAQ